MKKLIVLLVLFLAVSPAAICEEIRFADDAGTEFLFSGAPEKVCVLFSSYAEMWILAGGEVSVTVYESVERGFVDESTPLVDSGAGKRINLEALVFEMPDFVIGSMDIPAHAEAKDMLSAVGIPVALFRVECFSDYLRVMERFTLITGNRNAFETNGLQVQAGVEQAIAQARENGAGKNVRILFIRSGSGYSSCKAKTADMHFAADMLSQLGAENIADDVPVLLDGLSFEEILMKNPDAIFISLMGNEQKSKQYMESLLLRPEWQLLSAVQNGRVYFLPKELFQYKPNHRWAEAYGMLSEMLYLDE